MNPCLVPGCPNPGVHTIDGWPVQWACAPHYEEMRRQTLPPPKEEE